MSIKRVEVVDLLVFKGVFSLDLYPGINIIIGGNGTGKTTLIKAMYNNARIVESHYKSEPRPGIIYFETGLNIFHFGNVLINIDVTDNLHSVYIPEKDILEHAKGLLPFIMNKHTSFTQVYEDILVAAQDVHTKKQSAIQKIIGKKIADIIGGHVEWVQSDGMYYTIKADGSRIPFTQEASGFKKLGLLGLLLSCGQLEAGTVLFWDEPENSLNPELIPILVEILLELTQSGVQIFIATHSYDIVRYFDIREDKTVPVIFHNLTKTGTGQIISNSSTTYSKIENNAIEKAGEDLFAAVAASALGVRDDD